MSNLGVCLATTTSHVDEMTGKYDVEQLRALGGVSTMLIRLNPGPGIAHLCDP